MTLTGGTVPKQLLSQALSVFCKGFYCVLSVWRPSGDLQEGLLTLVQALSPDLPTPAICCHPLSSAAKTGQQPATPCQHIALSGTVCCDFFVSGTKGTEETAQSAGPPATATSARRPPWAKLLRIPCPCYLANHPGALVSQGG